MRILLKVPGLVWSILIVLIGVVGIQLRNAGVDTQAYFGIAGSISAIIIGLWFLAIIDHIEFHLKDAKNLLVTKLLVVALIAIVVVSRMIVVDLETFELLMVAILVFGIGFLVFMTMLVRQYLFRRSVWFIVLEVVFPVVGMVTLTPSIVAEPDQLNEEELAID